MVQSSTNRNAWIGPQPLGTPHELNGNLHNRIGDDVLVVLFALQMTRYNEIIEALARDWYSTKRRFCI